MLMTRASAPVHPPIARQRQFVRQESVLQQELGTQVRATGCGATVAVAGPGTQSPWVLTGEY